MKKNFVEITIDTLKKFCQDTKVAINAETKIIEDLGLESIDFVDFIFELERAVNIQIDIVKLSVALSKGTNKRFREVKVIDLAEYLENLN